MSLNAKGDKPEPPVEKRLADLERQMRKTRGANRRRAFASLQEADEKRALVVLEEMSDAATGKVKAELGALLCSTGIERFIERALRGKLGDVVVAASAPANVLQEFIARFDVGYARLTPTDVERRARALGLVPLDEHVELRPGSPGARVLVKLLDDDRLPRTFRVDAARALARVEPWVLWGRRDDLPVELGVAAGLAAAIAVPSAVEGAHFAAAVRAMSAGDRRATLALARLPASAARLPPDARVPLLALVLDDDTAPPADRAVAARALVELARPDADEAVLARPHAAPSATVDVCRRVDVEEARAVLAPLLRSDADARIAFANGASPAMCDGFVVDATSFLVVDPFAAAAILVRCSDGRAREELLAAVDLADATAARFLLCGVLMVPASLDARATVARATLADVLAFAALTPRARRPLAVQMLELMRSKTGVLTLDVDTALDALRRAL